MRPPVYIIAFILSAPWALGADYVVDEDLGVLPIGDLNEAATTVGGNNNSIYPKGIFDDGPLLNFGTEYVYQFELAQPSILSITSNDLEGNPDFFLLESLAVSRDVQSGKDSADGAIDAVLLDGAPPETQFFAPLLPGVYYLAVENYDGPDGSVVPEDASFDITLTVEEAIAIDFPIDFGPIGRAGTPVTFDTAGSGFDTELAIYDFFTEEVIATNDDALGGGPTSEITFPDGLPEGTYYAVIAGSDTTFGPSFALSGGGADGDWVFNFPLGPTFGPGLETGTTDASFPATAAQWFIFDFFEAPNATDLGTLATRDEPFTIDTVGSDFDTQLGLYDSAGFIIDFNDDIDTDAENFQSQLIFALGLETGEYYLALADFPNRFVDGFTVAPDLSLINTSEGGEFELNHPAGASMGSLSDDDVRWFRFLVSDPGDAPEIRITGVNFDPDTNRFTVSWDSNLGGPFQIFAGSAADLAALNAEPDNILPTQVAAGATSPTVFTVPTPLQGSEVYFQVTD